MRGRTFLLLAVLTVASVHRPAAATANWPQFRGPGAQGQTDATGLPLRWGDGQNIRWQTTLPGPGASSPITWGDRVFLTCHTGYATAPDKPGNIANLQRHLLCLNLEDGKILWDAAIPAEQPEQERIREDHGYASSTPAADAERVYTFFGKSGVFAFDHRGQRLWHTSVGTRLHGWGSATSPVLYQDLVLVNSSIESESVVALDKKTGEEVWRAPGIKDSWHAPALVTTPEGQTEIVIAMVRAVLGLDPRSGAQLWRADTGINWYMCPTPVTVDGIVYSIGGRNPNGGLALRAGGRGDVTRSHLVWKVNKGSNVPSPVVHEGHVYFAHENLGIVYCLDATTGQVVYEERLQPSPGQIYASPILAEGRLYYTGRTGRTVVVAARPRFEQLAENVLEGNRGVFNASAAVSGNSLLLRSNRALYRIGG